MAKDRTKMYRWKKSKYCQLCGKETDKFYKRNYGEKRVRHKILICEDCKK